MCVCLNKMKVFCAPIFDTHRRQSASLSVAQSVRQSVSQSVSQSWQQTLFSGSSRKREDSSFSATVVAVSIFVLISFSNVVAALRYCFLLALD